MVSLFKDSNARKFGFKGIARIVDNRIGSLRSRFLRPADSILKGVKMKNWLMILISVPILILCGCDEEPEVNTTTAERTINVQLNISSVPEKNLKLYVAKGQAASYQKVGDDLYKPENIEYSSRKSIGKTPLEKTFTFIWDSAESCWKPTEYAVYFVQKGSPEGTVGISPWSYHYKDPATAAQKVVFYDKEQFPLDYFKKNPKVRNLTIQKDLRLGAAE